MNKALLIVGWLGLLVSGYLLITYVSPLPLLCGTGGCHDVQASPYAWHFGLPTPLYGVIYYFLLTLLVYLQRGGNQTWVNWSLIVLTGIGFGVSAWLTYLEAFVVEAWCTWCVGSAILATIAFGIVWTHANKTTENH